MNRQQKLASGTKFFFTKPSLNKKVPPFLQHPYKKKKQIQRQCPADSIMKIPFTLGKYILLK